LRFSEELRIIALEQEPKKWVKKLKGQGSVPFYSLRVGGYRAILNIFNDRLVILVIGFHDRRRVYRNI
jgi:mRNA interferase RelE/StbE